MRIGEWSIYKVCLLFVLVFKTCNVRATPTPARPDAVEHEGVSDSDSIV